MGCLHIVYEALLKDFLKRHRFLSKNIDIKMIELSSKLGVLSSYKTKNGDYYSSYITGNNIKEINRKVPLRCLNEKIESSIQLIDVIPDFKELTNSEFLLKLPEVIHTYCFISYLALKQNRSSIEDILGDEGVIHELSHLLTKTIDVTDKQVNKIRRSLAKLHKKVIGLS